jgi:poly(3-hydroxybutyrate) depolymerase
MKASLFSALAAAALLASSTASFAAAPPVASFGSHDPYNRYDDRNSRDFNYGYDRSHRVTPSERARWEAAHRNDRKDDRRDYKDDVKDARRDYKNDIKDARRDYKDDRNSKDFNYGFDKKHRVTAQERARWEAAHRYDGRR